MAKLKSKSLKDRNSFSMDRRGLGRDGKGNGRAQVAIPDGPAAEKSERRKVTRRRQIDPTTCEREYTDEEIEFMRAMDAYRRTSGRMFPTCSEILEVLRDLGYRRTTETSSETESKPSSVAIPD